MSDPTPDPIGELFVESFNLDLTDLHSTARVALPPDGNHTYTLALRDDQGNFLSFVPADATPEMVAIAYRLYGQGLNVGIRAGEAAAWAKLRDLIGAAAATGAS